jgi:hypothetical protein
VDSHVSTFDLLTIFSFCIPIKSDLSSADSIKEGLLCPDVKSLRRYQRLGLMSDCRHFRVVRARVVDCRGMAASRLGSLQDGGGVGIETMSRQMFMSIDIRDEAKNAGEEEQTEAEEPRASFTKRLMTNFSREGSKEDLPKVMLCALKRAPWNLISS